MEHGPGQNRVMALQLTCPSGHVRICADALRALEVDGRKSSARYPYLPGLRLGQPTPAVTDHTPADFRNLARAGLCGYFLDEPAIPRTSVKR